MKWFKGKQIGIINRYDHKTANSKDKDLVYNDKILYLLFTV